ncbi:Mu transposase C-terminal domain-containing protein [Acinetobacter sp. YH12134]|uniref:Mu transposase C-terminal domain-containing protein n=1 Tax=Acinetobacter sp. YH12134 TaxID=2601118 RepID=UPI0015D1B92F|nr:Mu transposase C-terminal domain-containing protein [Acinetobacter sp. YH12134]
MSNELFPREGFRFILYGNDYEITAVIDNKVRFSSIKGGKVYNMPLDKFIRLSNNHEIEYSDAPFYPFLNEQNYEVINRKKRYIEAALHLPHLSSHKAINTIIKEVSSNIKDVAPPSSRTVIRWIKRFIEEEKFLTDFKHNQGNRSLRFSPDVVAILKKGIFEIFLKPAERRSAKDVEAYVVSQMLEKGIYSRPPTIRTIQRHIKALDQYDIVRSKKGIRVANKKFKAAGEERNSPFLLSIIEIDSHLLDVIVLDDHTFEVIGRPTLTCGIDVFSKCIVGWHLSILPPNSNNTLCLLKDMFTRPHRNLPGGIPSSIIPDNGVEFKNNALSSICENRKITIIPSQKHTPDDKPHIENFFRTFTFSFSQKLKGTTFSNATFRGEYNSKKRASLTFSNLRDFIHEWIECIYHQSKHSGIDNRIPLALWNETIKMFPVLSMSEQEMDILARIPKKRKVNNGRIHFSHLTYYSHVLTNENYDNKTVIILVDETNLERIYIRNPKENNSFIVAESTNPTYTKDLSLYEHLCIQEQKKSISQQDQRLLGEYTDLYARWKLYTKIQDTYAENKKLKKVKLDLPEKIQALLSQANPINRINTQLSDSMDILSTQDTSNKYSQEQIPNTSFADKSLSTTDDDDYESMEL